MADLKVKILADSNQAIQNVNNFNDVTKDTFKSLSKMQNELNKLGYYQNQLNNFKGSKTSQEYTDLEAALKKLTDAGLNASKNQEQFRYILEKTNNSFLTQGTGVQEYTKMLKNTDSWIQKLSASTRNSEFINSLYEYRTEIEKTVDALKEQEAEEQRKNALLEKQKRSIEEFNEVYKLSKSQNVDYLKATALGDKSFILKQQYSQLDTELTKLLTTEGKITPKTQELANRMVTLEKEMRKASKTPINERMANLVKSFVSAQAVVWAVSKVFRTLTSVIKESAEAASKAEETANLFNTTFETIQGTANKVAINLSSSLGMANSTIQQSLGLFGDLAMGYGQTQDAALNFAESAVQTGLDIMSFKNISGDTTEVLQTMASGLAGNFENFRKWGIIVTQAEVKTRLQQKGLDKLTGSSLQFAKVQETLAIVQEKSKNAQGDLQKTLESTENITRRVSEANKQLLENMGSGVNEVLNPIKKMWLDIAENINKANLAQKLYDQGQKDINVYDISNEDDYKTFKSNLRSIKWNTIIDPIFNTSQDETNKYVTSKLTENMIMFGASLDDVISTAKELKWEIDSNVIEALKKFEEELNIDITEQNNTEALKNRLQNKASYAANFIDSLANIQGVNLKSSYGSNSLNYVAPFYFENEENYKIASEGISTNITNAIKEAMLSLDSTTWQDFVNPIDLALGKDDSASALEEKLKSIYSLYEETYNLRMQSNGLDEEEKAELQQIADLYAKTKKEIEDINKLKEMRSKISSVKTSNEELEIAIAEIGMSDLEKSIASIQRELMQIAFSDLSKEEKEIAKALYERRIELIKEEDSAKKLHEAEQKYAETLEDIANKKLDLETKIRQFGMSDKEIALDEINQEWISALKDITDDKKIEEINKKFSEMIKLTKKFYTLQENEKKQQAFYDANREYRNKMIEFRQRENPFRSTYSQIKLNAASSWAEWLSNNDTSGFSDLSNKRDEYKQAFIDKSLYEQYAEMGEMLKTSLGETWQLFDAIGQLTSGGGFGGLLGILIDLTTQTEAFAKLGSLLSDHVVPVLDALLRPLLPVIELIGQSIAGVVEFFSAILYPLINEVSQALALVFGTIKSVIDFIVDGAKWVIGQIYMFFQNFINGVIGLLNNIPFVNIGYVHGGAVEKWATIDPVKNFENNMAEVLRTVQDIRDTNMEIADNTSDKNSEALKTIEDLYNRGLLTSTQRDAEVASLAGKYYDATKLFSGGSYRSTGYETTISYGDINITVNGSNANAADIAKEVKKVLEGQQRAGRNLISA